MNVLLTGATGFVGRQILNALLDRGATVRLVLRHSSNTAELPTELISTAIFTDDLFAEPACFWAQECGGVDTVIHSAWFVEPSTYLRSPKNLDCLTGTLKFAKGVTQAGVKRFIGVGTCIEYELSGGYLATTTPLNPTTPYSAAKAAAFFALKEWFPPQGCEFAWCRLFYLHGPGEDPRRFVPYLQAKLQAGEPAELTSGNQVRDFLDVRIAGKMIADVALSNRQGAINICSGIPITIRELAEQIAGQYNRLDLLRFGARPENLVDPPVVVGVADSIDIKNQP
jgi:dTDP-6-deoxy-L-talose 4-dehydrogenase (NAD+)